MRAVIQRVKQAQVNVQGQTVGAIGKGYVILLGVGKGDTQAQAEKLWSKILKLRIFVDDKGKTNLSVADLSGDVLIISQFTLYANCKKGNRPSFADACPPEEANLLYEYFVSLARKDMERGEIAHVATGRFAAVMEVQLVNNGPFTIVLDTDSF